MESNYGFILASLNWQASGQSKWKERKAGLKLRHHGRRPKDQLLIEEHEIRNRPSAFPKQGGKFLRGSGTE